MNIALTHATPGISLLDKEGRYLQINETYATLLGHSPEELLGRSWKLTVHPDDHATALTAFEVMWAIGKGEFEARAVRKDGSIFYKHVVMVKGVTIAGGHEGYHCFMRDISERKQAEERLQASENRYRTLVQQAPFCIHELDRKGRFLCVNPAGAKMVSLKDEQELIGRSYLDGVAVEDRGRIKALLSNAYQGKSSEFEFKMEGGGPEKIIASNFIPLKNSEGFTQKVMGISQDITERKRAEETLRSSGRAIRELYDITSVQHRSFEDRIRSLLDLGCRRFALAHGMLTRQIDDTLELAFLQSPDKGFVEGTVVPQCQAFCAEALKSDVPLGFEHAGQSEWRQHPAYAALGLEAYLGTRVIVGGTVYGTLCFASSTPHPNMFSVADKDFLQIMARWIGGELERKQAEEDLREAYDRMRALSRAVKDTEEKERTQFARELHDEFGQCLTALKLDLAWVARRLRTMSASKSQPAILNKIESMSDLVDQTNQAVRRIAASMRPRVLDDLGLVAALEWQAQECQVRSGIQCEVVVGPHVAEKEIPEAQSTTMFRIAQELSTNVMRHAKASDMWISLNEEGKWLVLSVKDNGIGVTQSSIDYPKSFGILGIRERASLVGGECTIVGKLGEGTTATIRIPLSVPSSKPR